ncbi:MAG: hypothetical protein ABIX01_21405 [Chitinophagaceae bacterium]
MKRKIPLYLFSFLVIASALPAQKANNCGFIIPPRTTLKTNFSSVYEARDIVNTMLDTIQWKENFQLQEQNGINNAYATIIRNRRYIVYDNDFLERVDGFAGTKWASISIMAHEMGHHYYNHVVSAGGSTLPKELEADGFSGYVMNRLGASLDQSLAAMQKIASDKASATHPGKQDRLAAITSGWNKARAEKLGGTNTGNGNGGTSTTTSDPNWIGLSMQSNQNQTVYLSDDGKTYQAAEIKAGETFVFKFEIYNYGWLRLPYYNGNRTFKLFHGKDYAIILNRKTKNWTVVEVPD